MNASHPHIDPALRALSSLVAQLDAGTGTVDLSEARALLADAAAREHGGTMSQVTASLVSELVKRDTVGIRKYGTSLDRDDLSLEEWLQHMKEEMLDGAGYAEAALVKLRRRLAQSSSPVPEAVG